MTWPAIKMEIFLVITLAKSINEGLLGKNSDCESVFFMFQPVGRVSRQNQQLWPVILHMVRCIRDFLKTFVDPFIPHPTMMEKLNILGIEGFRCQPELRSWQ